MHAARRAARPTPRPLQTSGMVVGDGRASLEDGLLLCEFIEAWSQSIGGEFEPLSLLPTCFGTGRIRPKLHKSSIRGSNFVQRCALCDPADDGACGILRHRRG